MEKMEGNPFREVVDHSFCEQTYPDPPIQPADLYVVEPILKSKDLKKIKRIIRSNHWLPNHPIRNYLWRHLCSLHTTERTSIYNETVNEVFGSGEQSHDVSLPAFVDPTTMVHYHLSPQGVYTAKRIMCVLGTTNPDITYAPTIFPLTCAFLHYLPEEAAYNALYSLVTSNKGFIHQTKVAHSTTKFVLKDLAKRYSKTWYNQTSKDGPELESVLSNWIWWILEYMPFTHMIRVLDCYFVEGPKVLFRVALAVLNLFSKSPNHNSPKKGGDMAAALAQFCEDIPVNPEKLLKVAFSIRGLSRKEITKLTVKNEMYVKSMKHTISHPTLPKSASCESLALKVSRSFSGPMTLETGSSLLGTDEMTLGQFTRNVCVKVSHCVNGNTNANARNWSGVILCVYVSIGILLNFDANATFEGFFCFMRVNGKKLVRTRSRSHGEVLPFNNVNSNLMTINDWQNIWRWLPTRMTLYQPRLVYTTAEHGTSIKTFYNCVDELEPTLMVLKTSKNEIIGAYCSTDWGERKKVEKKNLQYFGTGETFLFSLAPKRVKYEWVGKKLKEDTPHSAHLYMAGDNTKFTIGGGGGEGLQLDQNMDKGRSERCDTFGNPPLVEKKEFQCVAVEVFGFFQ